MEKLKLDIQMFGASVSLTASETAVDETAIQNNQTYINLSINVKTTKPTWNGNKTAYYQVTTTSQNEGTQTGSKYYFSIGSSTGSGNKTFTTTLGPFTHNPDGTLNNVSISTYVKITDSTNRTGTASVAMATIPRASQPSISANPTLGSQITIYTNRVSSSFTHTITYIFGNASGTIGTGVGDNVNWTPAIELAQQIPNATAGTGTITCETYNGGAWVGTKSVGFTATVPGSIVPSISLSNPTIGGSAPAGWGIFVKGKSTASYTITGTGNQGSTISQYQSSVAGYSYTTANVTTGILYGAGTQTISAKVIDSRGREATTSKTFNVVDYYNPSFTAVQIQRVDQNGNLDDNGEYAYFHFAGSVSSCLGNNKGTFKIAYRIKDTGSYTEKTIAINQESINQSGFITSDGTQSGTKIEFENTNTYDIKFIIADYFIAVENNQELDTGFDLINWNPSGKAMAIGKVSEAGANEELLEIGMNTNITGTLAVDKIDNTKGLYWKDGGWGDKFKIVPYFEGTDDSNVLLIQSAVGGEGTDPALYNIFAITALSGNIWSKGTYNADNGFYSKPDGNVDTQTPTDTLVIKRATAGVDNVPNTGVVLEYGRYNNWGGQLLITDNADTGLWWNGWSNGNRGGWKKLAFGEDTGWQSLATTSDFQEYSWGPLLYRKLNGVVTITGVLQVLNATTWNTLVATLPVGCRPPGEYNVICRTSWDSPMRVVFNSDGRITVLNKSDGTNLNPGDSLEISATFIGD